MLYVYCTCLSFGDVVAPIGAAAHHVCEWRLLSVSVRRVCEFLATVFMVTVGPAIILSEQGWQSCISVAHAGAAAASAAVITSMVGDVNKLKVLELGKERLHLWLHHGVGLIGRSEFGSVLCGCGCALVLVDLEARYHLVNNSIGAVKSHFINCPSSLSEFKVRLRKSCLKLSHVFMLGLCASTLGCHLWRFVACWG